MRGWLLVGVIGTLCCGWIAAHTFDLRRPADDSPLTLDGFGPKENPDSFRLARVFGHWKRDGSQRRRPNARKKDLAKRLSVGEILQILRQASAEQMGSNGRGRLKIMRFGVSRKRSRPSSLDLLDIASHTALA